jgi:putative restriction endonuclease
MQRHQVEYNHALMLDADIDSRVRLAAFAFLSEQTKRHGEVITRAVLSAGFSFEGQRVPLLGPQGIFKPAVCELPLSITTSPPSDRKPRSYDDQFTPEGLLRYRYRGADPQHHENVGLRQASLRQIPLIYFHGVVPGEYIASWPVFIVGDDPAALTFTVAVDEKRLASTAIVDGADDAEAPIRRRYVTRLVRQRLHQVAFRERVLRAYQEHCAICRLRHHELLEAVHILADADPEGEPLVTNGLALCKLHHAAFDCHFIGIDADYVVRVRPDILEEADGPMLQHGLKGVHGASLKVPSAERHKPDRELLEQRFAVFSRAG